VTAVDEGPTGTRLRALDAAGYEATFSVPAYAAVLSADASRLGLADLRTGDPIEVTWFPEGAGRTALSVRRLH
jgi:hypothetical protein